MKENRETHSLRFSQAGWKLITERARAIFGSERSRAGYLEDLTLKEGALNAFFEKAKR